MKKILISLASVLAATAAFAQTNTVLSKNAVGYERVDVGATGKFEFVRVDFRGIGGTTNTFYDYVGAQMPANSSVYFWNSVSQKWDTATRTGKGWGTASNRLMVIGESMFLKNADASTTNLTLYLMGEVPDTASIDRNVIVGGGGFTAASYPYPVSQVWTNTDISKKLVANDSVYYWNPAAGWQTYTKTGKGWGGATNFVVKPGQGLFIKKNSANGTNWLETKPYTWP